MYTISKTFISRDAWGPTTAIANAGRPDDNNKYRRLIEDIVTVEDLIRKILSAEFGADFVQNEGFSQMTDSIKRGLTTHLHSYNEIREKPIH